MGALRWPPPDWERDGTFPVRGMATVELFRGPAELGRPRLAHSGFAPPAATDLGSLARQHLTGIAAVRDELIVLDEGPERCRGGQPAHRILYTCLSQGLSLTAEHWVVVGKHELHALSAAAPTATWRDVEPLLRRVLRSFRGAG
jgi:hypothetical protein